MADKYQCLMALLCTLLAGCSGMSVREERADFTLAELLAEITLSDDGAIGRIREVLPAPEDAHARQFASRRPGFTTSDGYRVDGAWLNINPETGRVSSFSFAMGEESCYPLVEIPNFGKAFKRPVFDGRPMYRWQISLKLASVTMSVFNERQGCLRGVHTSLRNQWTN